MHKLTPMGSASTPATTNGSAKRRLVSWIESFVDRTEGLGSPRIFRQWTAIGIIGSMLEQRVWVAPNAGAIYPNLYIFLIGDPGTGKSLAIKRGVMYAHELADPHIAPTSTTFAALSDVLVRHKRSVTDPITRTIRDYNSTLIAVDELGAFIHKYDKEMADGLSQFYDATPYAQERRTNEVKIKIKSPLVSMLCGSTPSNLIATLPDTAWTQGFASRCVMVFSDETFVIDDFDPTFRVTLDNDLVHDLRAITANFGEYLISPQCRDAIMEWRNNDEKPKTTHPRLVHYNSRRKVNLYKLAMISAIDRTDERTILKEDFLRAKAWLEEAEARMPDIFKAAGGMHADARASDEILHYVVTENALGRFPTHTQLIQLAKKYLPLNSCGRVIPMMLEAGQLRIIGRTKNTPSQPVYIADLPNVLGDHSAGLPTTKP